MTIAAPSTVNTALVTGGSSGIGAEIAVQLGKRGWHVSLVARREPELKKVAKRVESAGGSASVFPCDIGTYEGRTELIDRLAESDRHVEILVNNAGKSTSGPVHLAKPDAELSMLALNVDAVVHLCTAFAPAMANNGHGAILNVASTAAFQPLPGQAGYGGTKAFVLSYSEAMRAEISSSGVNVTVLCPGPVDTGFGEAAGFDKAEAEAALPKFMWIAPEKVAEDGLVGLEANRMVVVPGAANRISSVFAHLSPKSALLPVLAARTPALRKK